ncbi:MAG: UDP-N-acetylglucosamine--N-acetylmuramyl-(pentapeptide) pyrophosphoryl-undecaprenol N-acetylglucosamine transferase, partial [Caldilineaceae bacterium]|nr:UDP-N-acetylglucosamine--N-acetylmuramyl-(pentapeptide) pyrophosphoryl-undecaprenol N-acetylglucosamine transferase [Caldilineaceae bacterium]
IRMNVLISGGGTGGHVYPALAVVAQLAPATTRRQRPARPASAMAASVAAASAAEPAQTEVRTLWVGSRGGMEKSLVERAGIPFTGISTGQLRVANPVKVVRNLGRMAAGVRQSLAIVDEFRPDVCFVTGGYVCGPVVMACALRKLPVLIYLPDMSPGYAIRMLSKLATRVAVTFPEVAHWFGGEAPAGKAVVTGYPVRAEVVTAAQDRQAARQQLAAEMDASFDETDGAPMPLLLVWGGSSGARAINQATWGALPALLPLAQIVHVVGVRDWPLYEAWAAAHPLPDALQHRYHAVAYLHEAMPLALAAADLTVARAGASTLGEFPVSRLPSVLAPLHSVNQADNAQALASRGAAVVVEDSDLPAHLAPTVASLLGNAVQRQAMEAALAQMAQPDAAFRIAAEIVRLA